MISPLPQIPDTTRPRRTAVRTGSCVAGSADGNESLSSGMAACPRQALVEHSDNNDLSKTTETEPPRRGHPAHACGASGSPGSDPVPAPRAASGDRQHEPILPVLWGWGWAAPAAHVHALTWGPLCPAPSGRGREGDIPCWGWKGLGLPPFSPQPALALHRRPPALLRVLARAGGWHKSRLPAHIIF